MKTTNVATINNVLIQVVTDNGKKLVPIKPICEALGIDEDAQRRKLKEDDFLNSTTVLSTVVAADGKEREMVCLPHEFIFGWLFTINPKNVKEEAREAVAKYRILCYKVLFNHFSSISEYLEEKQNMINEKVDKLDEIRLEFKNTERKLRDAKGDLITARSFSYEEWRANKIQMKMDFE